MTEQQQQPKQVPVLVSPNNSKVFLVDAIKPEFLGWTLYMMDIAPSPQQNGAQPETTQDDID